MKAEPNTLTVEELLDLRRQQMIIVNPEYQRGVVWTEPQKKKLVDSVLRGYPIPMFYFHHIKQSAAGLTSQRYEVIDGQQRINALWEFTEGAFKLFDPIKDEAQARFPEFIKRQPCEWGGRTFHEIPHELQESLLNTKLCVVRIETHDPNEARDLFVRLQSGIPLNAQEKRDAWPGQFTEYVLRVGGKPDIAKYAGHEFFNKLLNASRTRDRGKHRQLAAQIAMLFLTRRRSGGERFRDVSTQSVDNFYYENLDFQSSCSDAQRLEKVLDKLVHLLGDKKRKKLQSHEAIHLVLLVDSLMDDYAPSWETDFAGAFDTFRERLAKASKTKNDDPPDKYWLQYGIHARTNSQQEATIRRRHDFFISEMAKQMSLCMKDPQRIYGSVEREIVYYRDRKTCAVCKADVIWPDSEIHHVESHAKGGKTILENAALVHSHCHPKGEANEASFAKQWKSRFSNDEESQ